ncbi:MAG: hypothetical protein DME09_21215 [Candidatus Rokuibacteriota bacterium]|nr:MAG: hypothetical protein DME09_21215 [Candidatus Rokubacteria bacterium]
MHPREGLGPALCGGAPSLILLHNHPQAAHAVARRVQDRRGRTPSHRARHV